MAFQLPAENLGVVSQQPGHIAPTYISQYPQGRPLSLAAPDFATVSTVTPPLCW